MANLLAQFQKQDFDKVIEALKESFQNVQDENERLREENRQLKAENYKDVELSKLQNQLEAKDKRIEELLDSFKYGFAISPDENEQIRQWISNHERDVHGAKDGEPLYHGAIGGGYTYKFIPTSIGVIGYVECGTCHEDFTFTGVL